jgi:hypothetical protein
VRPDAHSVSQLATVGEAGLGTIFRLLRRATGVDFTHYRQTTILRAFNTACSFSSSKN